jgi:hypothetical protein
VHRTGLRTGSVCVFRHVNVCLDTSVFVWALCWAGVSFLDVGWFFGTSQIYKKEIRNRDNVTRSIVVAATHPPCRWCASRAVPSMTVR